ncbi:PaaI family thioesterase [Photobacterium sp. SDRW27]|uniref:PaaI family thioesterase n=1 Tax=Photobacterium obscurum TaxID=2829490 RepID=UPI002242D994|nr:PaaI family thioesterase [Photobacterium obscurum]MCW8328484.1 PaaI family thioesterase [Photobacterium obscurum]
MKLYHDTKQAHAHCIVCGNNENNPDTLQLAFTQDTDGKVTAPFQVTSRHQGYTGLLHGGLTSTLLDAAMTHCLFTQGIQALTAELTVRFIAPIQTGQLIMVTARLIGQRRGIYQLEALISQGQQLLARGTAKFIEPKSKDMNNPV